MALILHITVSLVFYYAYNYTFRNWFDKLMGFPSHLKDWAWVYIKGLVLLVLIPYICAESMLMGLLEVDEWNYNRSIMILPHFANLIYDRRIRSFIKNIFKL